jgi:threonine dehydrogenase-like Zn-dependent dehydrogenase
MDMVRRGGKIVPVALYEEPFESNPNPLVLKRIIVIGGTTADFFGAFELIKAGKITDKQVVTHTFPLDRINEAFETAMNPSESIKVMIEP